MAALEAGRPPGGLDAASRSAPTWATRRLTVLHIDDDLTRRQALQDMLRSLGHVAFQAESAPRGLELARLAMFDAIFLEIRLSGMGGVEAVQVLKASPGAERAVPVVAVTATDTPYSLVDYHAFGFCGVLFKPVLLGHLRDALERAAALPAGDAVRIQAASSPPSLRGSAGRPWIPG